MPDNGRQREFDDPIEAPDGTGLRTLREAVAFLAWTVPKSEQDMPAVTTAAQMLTFAAERELAWVFMARMATLKAIHRKRGPAVQPQHQRAPLGKAKAEAGYVIFT